MEDRREHNIKLHEDIAAHSAHIEAVKKTLDQHTNDIKEIKEATSGIPNGLKQIQGNFKSLFEKQKKSEEDINTNSNRITAVETNQRWTFRISIATLTVAAVALGKKFLIAIGISL